VLASDQARVATQAAVSLALVDLYRSLGGGWQSAAGPAAQVQDRAP